MIVWHQTTVRLRPFPRGFHLITDAVVRSVPEITTVQVGMLHVFILHTSASLTLNENADPDVRADFETAMNEMVPDDLPFKHTIEGLDDMPAHVKSSLMGSSLTIPIRDGLLCMGTWQGIYLCEHRNEASHRSLMITLMGKPTRDPS
jgi:secondary thiamine-phosphate synthase enzyme